MKSINIFIIFSILSLTITYLLIDKIDKKLIKIMFTNKQISKIFTNTVISFRTDSTLDTPKWFNIISRVIYIVLLILYLIFAPIILLPTIIYNRYLFSLKHPLSIKILNGFLYSLVQRYIDTDEKTIEEYNSKLYWYELFKNNKVNTPKVYGQLNNGKYIGKIPKEKNLIWKPTFGTAGAFIYRYTTLEDAPKIGKFILQERILTCNKHIDHVRIITVKKDNKVIIFNSRYHYQKDKNNISSNTHQDGKLCYIDKNKCIIDKKSLFNIPQNINERLELVEKDCIKLHEKLDTHSIGWDIVFSCDNYYFLEGNVGVPVCYGDNSYYECIDKFLEVAF